MHVRLRGYYAQIRLIVPIGVLVATRPCPCSRNSQYQTNGACQRFPLTRLDRPPVPSRGTLLLQHGCHVAGAMRADAARSCSSRLPGRLYA